MLRKIDSRYLFGGLLIAVGILFLLQEFNIVSSAWSMLWAAVFGVAGLVFLYAYTTDRTQWWPIIPGLALLGLGALIILEEFFNIGNWGGAIFLGALGLSFIFIYIFHRQNWWAIIPGGVLLTLAFVAGFDDVLSGDAGGGIFFLGLGLTFLILGLLPTEEGRMKWAFIPAAVLLLMGLLLTPPLSDYFMYFWPIGLIGLGLYFILRNLRK